MVDPFVAVSRFLFDQALRLDPGHTERGKPEWPAGTRLEALVRAVAEPSRALLQIGDQLIDARLPALPKPGERLTLRVVEPLPRLVFALEAPDAAPQRRDTTQVSLSSAARILGEVVGRPSEAPGGRPLPLGQSQALPLPTAAAPHAEEIALHLRQTLEKSGLFYEKHQARWVAGDYPLSELKQEPQAQRAGGQGQQVTVLPAQSRSVASHESPAQRAEFATTDAATDVSKGALRTPPEARAMSDTPLRGQLELLDGRGLNVAMPAWAGRELQWELPEREPQTEGEEAPAWSTRLAVELPNLGAVQAHLRISGTGLALSVTSASSVSSQRLAAAQSDLMKALREAGLSLNQLTIVADRG